MGLLPESLSLYAILAGKVSHLQCAPQDSVLTELDIARSLLANQRHQELAAMEAQQQSQRQAGGMGQHLVAFPLRLGSMQFNLQVSLACSVHRLLYRVGQLLARECMATVAKPLLLLHSSCPLSIAC